MGVAAKYENGVGTCAYLTDFYNTTQYATGSGLSCTFSITDGVLTITPYASLTRWSTSLGGPTAILIEE